MKDARTCMNAISVAIWDLENARMVLRGVARGKTPCKNPKAAVVEYIGSAQDVLKEASKATANLPTKPS